MTKFILNLILWLAYQTAFYSKLVVKSNVFKTIIVAVVILLIFTFVPYWAGLLVVTIFFSYATIPGCWAMGVAVVLCAFAAGRLIALLWTMLYDEVKRSDL